MEQVPQLSRQFEAALRIVESLRAQGARVVITES